MSIRVIKNTILQSTSYIIGNYLIDCGDGDKINSVIKENGISLRGIFLTHCHIDHIYGLPNVIREHPETMIYCSKATFEGLKDETKNLKYLCPDCTYDFCFKENIVIMHEGLHTLNDDTKIEIIATPGHSNDSQSYIITNNIFTGDAYIPGEKVFTKWSTSNKRDAQVSVERILSLVRRNGLTIRPGHWKAI